MSMLLIGIIFCGIAGVVIEIMKQDLVHQQEIQQIKKEDIN